MKHMWSEEEIQALIESQGGGEGGGGKLYQHVCHITDDSELDIYCLEIITRDNTPLTLSNLVNILKNRYTASESEDFHVIPTRDIIYVARAYIFASKIRIRKSTVSDITNFVNFDITKLKDDIISEI